MSSTATRAVAEEAYNDQANWTLTEDFPTPPFPDKTIMIFLTSVSLCEMSGFMQRSTSFATTTFMASVTQPLLDTIEADDPAPAVAAPTGNIGTGPTSTRPPVVLTPSNRAPTSTTPADLEAG